MNSETASQGSASLRGTVDGTPPSRGCPKPRGEGCAGRLHVMESVALGYRRLSDYWMVRALRAEGHDLAPRPHPSQEARRG